MHIVREEIFGPVVTVTRFSDEDEAVAIVNESEYGPTTAIYTADTTRGFRVARRIDVGMGPLRDARIVVQPGDGCRVARAPVDVVGSGVLCAQPVPLCHETMGVASGLAAGPVMRAGDSAGSGRSGRTHTIPSLKPAELIPNAALKRSRFTSVSRAVISTSWRSSKYDRTRANSSSVTSTGVRITATA